MGPKLRTFFSDLAQGSEAPHLETAGVCEQRTVPADETMQSARGFDYLNAGSQPQVISVSEDDARIQVRRFEFFEANAFDGTGSSDRHEDRRFDLASTCFDYPGASGLSLRDDLEAQGW